MSELSVNDKLERIEQEIRAISKEMEREAMSHAGRMTTAWKNMRKDQLKLKAEYEKILHSVNAPHTDVNSVASKLAAQSRALKSALEKRPPQHSHYRRDS